MQASIGPDCVPLEDGSGGYRCTGNTGPRGFDMYIEHTMPIAAGVLNVRFYSTDNSHVPKFYNSTDTSFTICATQATGLPSAARIVDVPGVLVRVGDVGARHRGNRPLQEANHWARPGVREALEASASKFNSATSGFPIYVNDVAMTWGGVFDIKFNWKDPHIQHSYGFAVDVRTKSPGTGNSCFDADWLYGGNYGASVIRVGDFIDRS